MASNGSFLSSGWYSSSKGDYVYLEFAWHVSDTSVENNQKTIYWELRGKRTASGYVNAGGFQVIIDGQTVYSKGTDYRIELYNGTVIASGSKTFTHNTDGTRSFSVSIQGAVYTYAVNCSGGASFTLDTIPRVSAPTVSPSPVTLPGGTLRIKTNRNDNTFVHYIGYTFGNLEDTVERGVGAECTWAVPEALAEEIPDSTTGTGTIKCVTHTAGGASVIGEDTADFVVTIPNTEATRPKLKIKLSPVADVPEAFSDLYIQGKSRLKAEITATPWHSSIDRHELYVQGSTYKGGASLISNVLSKAETTTVWTSATDKRDFSGSVAENITVLPYDKPRIVPVAGSNSVVCCRCNAEGAPDINGTRLLVRAGRAWSGLNGRNTCTLRWRIKPENGAYGDWQGLLAADAEDDEAETVLSAELDLKLSYAVQLQAVDGLQESTTVTMAVGTANTPLHLGRGGRNMGLGRYCDYGHTDAIDVGWPMFMENGLVVPDDVFFSRGDEIADGTDLNTVIQAGIYRMHDNYTYINGPEGLMDAPAVMLVFNPYKGVKSAIQIIFNYSGEKAVRRAIWYQYVYNWKSF